MTSQSIEIQVGEIIAEVERAMELHPPMNSAHEAWAVIMEELDEFWEMVKLNPSKLSAGERAVRVERMHKELTHTAAMCIRAMQDLAL